MKHCSITCSSFCHFFATLFFQSLSKLYYTSDVIICFCHAGSNTLNRHDIYKIGSVEKAHSKGGVNVRSSFIKLNYYKAISCFNIRAEFKFNVYLYSIGRKMFLGSYNS